MIAGKLPGAGPGVHPKMALFPPSGVLRGFPAATFLEYISPKTLVRPCSTENRSFLNWTHNDPFRVADNLLAFQFELQKDLLLPPFHQWYFPNILKSAVNFYSQASIPEKFGYSLKKISKIFSGDPDTLF